MRAYVNQLNTEEVVRRYAAYIRENPAHAKLVRKANPDLKTRFDCEDRGYKAEQVKAINARQKGK